jgi:hypothetical protein
MWRCLHAAPFAQFCFKKYLHATYDLRKTQTPTSRRRRKGTAREAQQMDGPWRDRKERLFCVYCVEHLFLVESAVQIRTVAAPIRTLQIRIANLHRHGQVRPPTVPVWFLGLICYLKRVHTLRRGIAPRRQYCSHQSLLRRCQLTKHNTKQQITEHE